MKKINVAVAFVLLFVFAAVATAPLYGDESGGKASRPAASQTERPWLDGSWQTAKLNFFLSSLDEGAQADLVKSPSRQRADYELDVWKAAARLFEPRGSEPSPRQYDAEQRTFLGDQGRLSDAQFAALETFVAPYLESPRRALADDEKTAVADAFALSRDRLDLMTRAFDAFIRDSYGDDPVRTSCVLFGEKIAESVFNASYDELAVNLAALLEKRSTLKCLDEIRKLPRVEQAVLLDCILDRLGARLGDYEYAQALYDSVDNLFALQNVVGARHIDAKDGATAFLLVEERLEKATAARPQSWEVAQIAAATIWQKLPHTFKPSDDQPDGAPQRAYCLVPAPRDPDKDVVYIDGPPMTYPETTLFSEERDRAVALQTLVRALPDALASGGALPKETRVGRKEIDRIFPQRLSDPVSFSLYFNLIAETTRLDQLNGRACDLEQKTDLTALPPLRTFAEWDAKRREKSPQIRHEYELPDSFEDAANDGERLEYAKLLVQAVSSLQPTEEDSPAYFFARLGTTLQRRLGVRQTLERAYYARQTLAQTSPLNAEGVPEDDKRRQEIARLDALVAEIPTLKDSETLPFSESKFQAALAVSRASDKPFDVNLAVAKAVCPERRALSGACDFIAFLKRSLELEENADALAALASEYQLRGHYAKALELWKRVKTAKIYSREKLSYAFGIDSQTQETVAKNVDLQIAALQSAASVKIADDGSESEGLRVSLNVDVQNVRTLKTTFYQLNLAPFVAKTNEKSFYNPRNESGVRTEKTFVNFVAGGVREYLAQKKPISDFAKETTATLAPVHGDEERSAAPTRVPLTFTLEKPGAYLVKVADADNEENADYALAFANRYAFSYQFGRLLATDFQTGKPCANRETTLLLIGSELNAQNQFEPKAQTTTVKTDELGIVQLDADLNALRRVVAFVEDDAPEENDFSLSFFDSLDSSYSASPQNAFAIKAQSGSVKLILATNRPIYAPGENVEFVAQTAPRWNAKIPNARVRVYKILNLPPQIDAGVLVPQTREIANFPVSVDETGGFSGSFAIPEDAEPGKYVFQFGSVIEIAETRKPRFVGAASSTLYVSTRGETATAPATPSSASAETTSDAPMIALDFDKPTYSLDVDQSATTVVRSAIPDASVVVERVKEVRRADLGRIDFKLFDARRVELRDGRGECRLELNQEDAPCFTVIANVARDGKAQTFYYLVGAQSEQYVRDANIEVPAKARPGEKVVLTAKFKPLNGDAALFAGRASVALYDKRLELVPVDDFASYLDARRVATRLLERQDYSPTKTVNPLPTRPRQSQTSATNGKRAIYQDFVAAAVAPANELKPQRYVQMQKEFELRPPQFPNGVDSDDVPSIPASASSDSILKETTVEKPTDSLSFEFDAPKTPGTYRIVFRAFDPEKGAASFLKRDLTVE